MWCTRACPWVIQFNKSRWEKVMLAIVGCKAPCGSSPHALAKAQLMSLSSQASKAKQASHMLKERKRRKERNWGHSAKGELKQKEVIRSVCVFCRVSKKHKERESFRRRGAVRKIERKYSESVRVKEKWDFFSAQTTHKKDKLVEFSWSLEYYYHGELRCSKEDLYY